jgi:hypothetical protein
MLYGEFVKACYDAVDTYHDRHSIYTSTKDRAEHARTIYKYHYEIAQRLYVKPRLNDICQGLSRHHDLVLWMLENQRLVLRYERYCRYILDIIDRYKHAVKTQAEATDTIQQLTKQYPELHLSTYRQKINYLYDGLHL